MESPGSLVDKISVINKKIYEKQDILYKIRKMNQEQFLSEYSTKEKLIELFCVFQSATDLNYQRSVLVTELDQKLIDLVRAGLRGEDLEQPAFIAKAHKSY